MTDPFMILGPAAISFSGGRTSAYMLRRILDAHAGVLPDDVHVLFANTGKEREETLSFIHEIETRWDVHVHWLEYRHGYEPSARMAGAFVRTNDFTEVDYESASRHGEPFEAAIRARSYLPNPVTRFCTAELKVRTMHRYLRAHGITEWTQVVGLRADEPGRVAKILSGSETAAEEIVCPLRAAGITKTDVMAFWRVQPFDLRLRSYEGNCDLCFLKGQAKRVQIMSDQPDLAAWWIERERIMGSSFRAHGPDYATLLDRAKDRKKMLPLFDMSSLDEEDPTDNVPCHCTD